MTRFVQAASFGCRISDGRPPPPPHEWGRTPDGDIRSGVIQPSCELLVRGSRHHDEKETDSVPATDT
jgi:hypothetical protein